MLSQLFTRWARSGTLCGDINANDFSHIRIGNIIALIVLLMLTTQLPLLFYLQPVNWLWLTLNILLHVALLALVPVLNHHGLQQISRHLLISLYISYLLMSCILWQQDIGVQYFFLIGIFVSVFLYPQNDVKGLCQVIALFCLCFLLTEMKFIFSSWQHLNQVNQYIQLRNTLLLVAASVACAVSIYRVNSYNWQRLANAHRKSEALLTDILPGKVCHQLKQERASVTEYFPQVSILFADMQGYTGLTNQCQLQQLVEILDQVYSRFDKIAAKYGLHKIKTNGDQYMAVAGIPSKQAAHARLCCAAALEMRYSFQEFCQQQRLVTGLRIGIGSGEAIAGVIGQSSAHYDVWGEAVNLASRLESQGEVDHIQVSTATQRLAARQFSFSYRGQVALKGLGYRPTFWLVGKQHKI